MPARWHPSIRGPPFSGASYRPLGTRGSPSKEVQQALCMSSCGDAAGLEFTGCNSLRPSSFCRLAAVAGVAATKNSEAPPLPMWDKVFSNKFMFSETLPSVIPPLHAALFAKANIAARMAGSCSRGVGVFAGGIPTFCTAVAAASMAAFGSWRLLGLASRSLRGLTTQRRLAEARAYGPLHSLDATLKPIRGEDSGGPNQPIGAASGGSGGCNTSRSKNQQETTRSSNSSAHNHGKAAPPKQGIPANQQKKKASDVAGCTAVIGTQPESGSTSRKGVKAPSAAEKSLSEESVEGGRGSNSRRGRKGGKGSDETQNNSKGAAADEPETASSRRVP